MEEEGAVRPVPFLIQPDELVAALPSCTCSQQRWCTAAPGPCEAQVRVWAIWPPNMFVDALIQLISPNGFSQNMSATQHTEMHN